MYSYAKEVLEHMKQFEVRPMINKEDYMYVNNVYDNLLELSEGPFNNIEYESRGGKFNYAKLMT